jgi:hypothetical protein
MFCLVSNFCMSQTGRPSVALTAMLQFYPHFSISLAHMPSPSVPMPPTHMLSSCAFRLQDSFSLMSHSHALSYLPMPLFGSLQLCQGFLSHSSNSFIYNSLVPFSTIYLPHLICFLIPTHVSDTLCFTFIRGLMLLSLILYYS